MKYKEKYERLYKEHCRICKELRKNIKQRIIAEDYARAIRDGEIRLMLTLISIFAVVLGIIYFCIK